MSVSEPHTSAFSVEFFLYGMYVSLYVAAISVSRLVHCYCLHVCLFSSRASMSNSETMLDRH